MRSKALLALATLIATAVGIGVFALPYSFARNGPLAYLSFFFAGGVILAISLIYGEVIFRTKSVLHLTGYVREHLGTRWSRVAFFIDYASILLTVVIGAYVIGGRFLPIVFPSIDGWTAGLVFLLIVLLFVIFNLRSIAEVEFILNFVMALLFLALSALALSKFHPQNLVQPVIQDPPLTYGVALFAFSALSIMPELKELLGNDFKLFKKTVITGYLLIGALYLLFTVSMLGAAGIGVSQDALSSLANMFPPVVAYAAVTLAVVNIFKTLIAVGYYIKETFLLDFRLGAVPSYLLFAVPTLVLYTILPKNFVWLIEVTGAVSIGLTSLFVLSLYWRLKEKKFFSVPQWFVAALGIVFVLGIVVTQIF